MRIASIMADNARAPLSGFFVLAMLIALAWCAAVANADDIDGFTEPDESVNVSAVEVGIIESLEVQEGDRVHQGQPLATLDRDVLQASLSVARQAMESQGRLKSAEAELRLRQTRLEKLKLLQDAGHARPDEVERAEADVEVYQAQLLAAEEDLAIKRLEHDRIRAQLERRVIRSPMDGVVATIHKKRGEYVAPNSPELVTVVRLDKLLATFSVPDGLARALKEGGEVALQVGNSPAAVAGTIAQISPMIDAESGTIRVRVRFDNAAGHYRSGQRCVLSLPSK